MSRNKNKKLTDNREYFSRRNKGGRGLHEEPDSQETVAQPCFERHEDGKEDQGQHHVVGDHQGSGEQKLDHELTDRSHFTLSCFRLGVAAFSVDDEHGVRVVEEVEDGEAHVVPDQVVLLAYQVVATFAKNLKRNKKNDFDQFK